ncbi:hypothetical protein PT974_01197 [Cladobotryum mycophilum]|uniref:NAD-dependent epimerase/dehydratase domain-containing protein n=1 Tax=Cladobotryum mycophilum TaxID=491253 RepID=A0ABR0T395_9HYPO
MSPSNKGSKAGRIFMTGASGYVGSAITRIAIEQGYTVVGLSRSDASDAKLGELGAQPVRGDLASLDILSRESAAADIVIHLADPFIGSGFAMPYDEVVAIDAAAVEAMATPLIGTNKPLVATSGSLMAAPDPHGGETTEDSENQPNPLANRHLLENNILSWASKGVRVSLIRLAPFVYGRAGSFVAVFMKMHAPNKAMMNVVPADGKPRYTSTVHIDDAARLYFLAAEKAKAGEIYNAVSATDVTIRQIMEAAGQILSMPVEDVTFDEASAKIGKFVATFLTLPNRASGGKAVRELGWQPKEIGVLEEITNGSYLALAGEILKTV